jgi:hypothetical protein
MPTLLIYAILTIQTEISKTVLVPYILALFCWVTVGAIVSVNSQGVEFS